MVGIYIYTYVYIFLIYCNKTFLAYDGYIYIYYCTATAKSKNYKNIENEVLMLYC